MHLNESHCLRRQSSKASCLFLINQVSENKVKWDGVYNVIDTCTSVSNISSKVVQVLGHIRQVLFFPP